MKEYVTVMPADGMSVPVYNVSKALVAFEKISSEYDIHIPAYGHEGDGNLHTKGLMDPTNPDHWRQAEETVTALIAGRPAPPPRAWIHSGKGPGYRDPLLGIPHEWKTPLPFPIRSKCRSRQAVYAVRISI